MDLFNYHRRPCRTVTVGGTVKIGGNNPIAVQSMTNTNTNDVEGSVAQIGRIAAAGAPLVRLTAQGVREAESIGRIRELVDVPLVADIHFNPEAAMAAAAATDKVRINPGNFCHVGVSPEQAMTPLLALCKEHGTALRIGVNHGSLSRSIMERYGDTPEGMVESAMEFLRVCAAHDFHQVVVSIKASNVVVMVRTVRMLTEAMHRENLEYPVHLGVTEAGDGEDGRVKSAAGIGTLLAQGIGDTIRVSLSEDPELEVPVARALLQHIGSRAGAPQIDGAYAPGYDPMNPQRLRSRAIGSIGGDNVPAVYGLDTIDAEIVTVSASATDFTGIAPDAVVLLTSAHTNAPGELQAARHRMLIQGVDNPVIMQISYDDTDAETLAIKAAADFGAIMLNGTADGISIDSRAGLPTASLALGILQATRSRISKTEFISCPSCGRTLFDLQATLKAVKSATAHLKGLKIGVMGCIVNGPGEMADADYGYVGAGPGRISLYRRRECIVKNIPQEEAIERLVNLIKENGDWKDPDQTQP
ncbi:MAG: (E)-4-hydroxy-3-methylbut-2-enyl-diphosphate synthase [Muribaculaceae bacterium]|nr:(E)-4-hydroxy-3-methylbut-2-enyl-diphosphate synthase [Muribaculaceae bacterium]